MCLVRIIYVMLTILKGRLAPCLLEGTFSEAHNRRKSGERVGRKWGENRVSFPTWRVKTGSESGVVPHHAVGWQGGS